MSEAEQVEVAEKQQPKGPVDFTDRTFELNETYVEDMFEEMRRENRVSKYFIRHQPLNYLNKKVLDYIFTMCTRLRLPPDVRFTAALIFDKYMSRQTAQAHHFIDTLELTQEQKDQQWDKTQCNIIRQLVLRLASCIQIASKENKFDDSLSNEAVTKMLVAVGSPYHPQAILKSELRVLSTIDYTIPQSPAPYMENILKVLANSDRALKHCNEVWDHALLFLDMTFAYQRQITNEFNCQLNEDAPPNKERKAVQVMGDWMLVGSACIVCGLGCVHGMEVADQKAIVLGDITKIDEQHIVQLASTIMKTVRAERQRSAVSTP
ncbi:unnamed protein product, partial [Mesorhabditis spiculigera]